MIYLHFTKCRAVQSLTAVAIVVAAGACGGAANVPPPAFPPVEVTVVTVEPQTVDEPLEFTGQVDALRSVQVHAQASGVIVARNFREGAQVQPKDILYLIDSTTYAASYRSSAAQLEQAEAQLANAELVAQHQRELIADNATARQSVDSAETAVRGQRANVDNLRALLETARYNLEQTRVRAQIAGRVGPALIDIGTRVTGPNDVLTTIDVVDPIYVSFRPSAVQQLSWKSDPTLRHVLEPGGMARVQPMLADGTAFGVAAPIDFVNPVIDSITGTQQLRARFANPNRLILPGQFVRVRLLGVARPNSLLVPQRAIVEQMGRQTLFVVDSANKIAPRVVTATTWTGPDVRIDSGLRPGERVVVDGIQKVQPGMTVHPTPLPPTPKVTDFPEAKQTSAVVGTRVARVAEDR
ncbi:MAG TPA: efflux RND transporter periplasmic adaptor subunit [Gemmatimonadaceae bacterium]|nr:efflux RND transporter periplasmic adaptor subunit [Gemmatimonadaceae bacterium]